MTVTVGLAPGVLFAAERECDPRDQLVCVCENAGYGFSDPEWKACFLGDLNYTTVTQVDRLSSRAFMALNWPTDATGAPDFEAARAGDWTPVWATWKSTNAIFRGTRPPLAWDKVQDDLPQACQEIDHATAMASVDYARDIPDDRPPRLLDEYLNPEGHALLDAAGIPVRYDVIFNRQAYEYVVENKLWNARALERFIAAEGRLDLPEGTWDKGADDPARRGAIVLKTAWKLLSPQDDPASFHKQWAYVTPVVENGKRTHECQLRPVGLIGMHVVYKTDQMPDWAWGSFEHAEIAPLWAEVGATSQGLFESGAKTPDWIFYANDHEGAAIINKPPKTALTGKPSRIVKSYPPGYYFGPVGAHGATDTPCGPSNQEFRCINALMQEFLAGSVFANYILIGTQWRASGANYEKGLLIPEILGNATMESFTQATSSCISCHSYAAPADISNGKGIYDFLFSFERDVSTLSVPVQGQ